MVDGTQVILLVLVVGLSFSGFSFLARSSLLDRVRAFAVNERLTLGVIAVFALAGCLAVAGLVHAPIPRITDEFSYLLSADTLASGRISNSTPASPEFFDTFHVLVRPAYVSKYFPGQGLFLALGQKLTGHPATGVWLSSALACGATIWILKASIVPMWGLLGAFLMAMQFGIFSYWSQSYWGGMVAALGGALYFGAVRRLCNRITWQSSAWAALGIVILVNSRPLEGALSVAPITTFLIVRMNRRRDSANL